MRTTHTEPLTLQTTLRELPLARYRDEPTGGTSDCRAGACTPPRPSIDSPKTAGHEPPPYSSNGRQLKGPASATVLAVPRAETPEQAKKACQKFEGFLLGEMLKQMRDSESDTGGVLPVSRGEHIFIRQQCETLGDILAAREPLGLSKLLQQGIVEQDAGSHGRSQGPVGGRTGEMQDAHRDE